MLQLIIVVFGLYIVYLLETQHTEAAKRKDLENEVEKLKEELKKYKVYERNYQNLKKSYLDLLDKAVKQKKKGE
ncbi:hypothetical protein NEMIN01_0677 [Nematocida minor]|uniref:uncharacterized protein n=1 Tax=Nematocida minor TaxID=1912983 RepID=UPI002220C603|nr:uncharacterized protein NEMIN01_0677 [Nematocida minor]KAI5189814.1 hypothetical protein NEMIN01_0677 [Nematocida minor]